MITRIVTNGKKFRIEILKNAKWTPYEVWHSDPERGWHSPWETRFYLRALKRLGKLIKAQASASPEIWTEVSI